jgi:hypothetical protein
MVDIKIGALFVARSKAFPRRGKSGFATGFSVNVSADTIPGYEPYKKLLILGALCYYNLSTIPVT